MSDSDKYAQIQSIGEEKENIKDINQTNKDIWSDGWLLGFFISLLAVILPAIFAVIAGMDFSYSIGKLLKSSNISLLCVSTTISILSSYSWNGKFIKESNLLLAFIFTSNMIYGFVSFAEYIELSVNCCLMVIINIIITSVMLYIMFRLYKYKK